ncbi:MAG: hypothetical protein VX765_00255 [Pseudomonadota bacterium]|nr:hypothetical protein [Pseudomonadota bacterium]
MNSIVKNKIYLHIGTAKTGTTSLQKYLYENRDNLKSNGFVYPEPYTDPNVGQCKNGFKFLTRLINGDDINHILDEYIEKYPSHNIIISEEAFLDMYIIQPHVINQLLNIKKKYNVNLIVYYRRIIEFMVAYWGQKTKEGFKGSQVNIPNIENNNFLMAKVSLEESLENIYQYHKPALNIIKQLEMLSESNNIKLIVRPYCKKQMIKKNIIDDFCNILGIENIYKSKFKENMSFTREMTDILYFRNKIYEKVNQDCEDEAKKKFFQIDYKGETNYFFGNTSLIESISDNLIKEVTDKFSVKENNIYKKITGYEKIFDTPYPECYENNRDKYHGVNYKIRIIFYIILLRKKAKYLFLFLRRRLQLRTKIKIIIKKISRIKW